MDEKKSATQAVSDPVVVKEAEAVEANVRKVGDVVKENKEFGKEVIKNAKEFDAYATKSYGPTIGRAIEIALLVLIALKIYFIG